MTFIILSKKNNLGISKQNTAEDIYLNLFSTKIPEFEDVDVKHENGNLLTILSKVIMKIQTILSGATNSSQYCSVYGVSPRNMNSFDILNKEYAHREVKYGLQWLDLIFLDDLAHCI